MTTYGLRTDAAYAAANASSRFAYLREISTETLKRWRMGAWYANDLEALEAMSAELRRRGEPR